MGRGRKPKCKNCTSYVPQPDGSVICEYSGKVITADSSALFDDGACYERKKKPKITPAELSKIRSAAGRKGGRAAGYGKGRAPTKQLSVRLHDYNAFSNYSQRNGFALAEQFHDIAKKIVIKHPELKPPDWID